MDFTLPHLLKDGGYPVGGRAMELNCWPRGLTDAGHVAGAPTFAGVAALVKPDERRQMMQAIRQRLPGKGPA
jgi:hypothetical protein